jgi:hypothetical protein
MLQEQDADEREKERQKTLASFEEFRQTWRELPSRANTVELLFRASELDNGRFISTQSTSYCTSDRTFLQTTRSLSSSKAISGFFHKVKEHRV